jgi:hypothetical protein
MKHLSITCLFVFSCLWAFSQTEALNFKNKQLHNRYLTQTELKDQLEKYDFSKLFTHTDNSIIYGFIGNNYQRIRIKLISVTKDLLLLDTYHVYGKSMVKNNINEFNGTIKLSNIRKLSRLLHGCENESEYSGYNGEFILLGDYNFQENNKQNHAGIFKGSLRSDFFINKKNRIQYNDIEICSDNYSNNQFVGQWVAYNGNIIKRCNWGDFRIPNSGHFDIGAGDFSPDDKYLKYGWQGVRDLDNGQNSKKAKIIENVKWWK